MKAALTSAMKEAMKAKDALRRDTIRSIIAAFQYAEMEKGVDSLPESEGIAILKREVKKRREEIEFATKAERPEALPDLERELEVIESFLPSQLSEEELEKIISSLIEGGSASNLGAIMKHLSTNFGGQYDGKVASALARRLTES